MVLDKSRHTLSLDSADKSENVLHEWGQMEEYYWASHVPDHDPRAKIRIKKHKSIQGLIEDLKKHRVVRIASMAFRPQPCYLSYI